MSIESAMRALESAPQQDPQKDTEPQKVPVQKEVPPGETPKKDLETQELKQGELAPEVKDAPKEEEKPDAKRWSEISKKEQRIRLKQQKLDADFKAREEALAQREAKIKSLEELPDLFQKNPKEAFKRLNTSYNQVSESLLSDGKPTVEKLQETVEQKFGSIDERIEKKAQEIAQRAIQELEAKTQQKENARILQEFGAKIVDTVKTNADKFPAVSAFNGAPVIYEMIQQRFQETGGKHLMNIDEAAELLEKDLDSHIEKILQHPKYAARLSPQSKNEGTKQNSNLNKPKTITNEMTSTAPSMLPAKTEQDRINRALAKL